MYMRKLFLMYVWFAMKLLKIHHTLANWWKYGGRLPIGEIPRDVFANVLLAKFQNPVFDR